MKKIYFEAEEKKPTPPSPIRIKPLDQPHAKKNRNKFPERVSDDRIEFSDKLSYARGAWEILHGR